jgi:hypothetical protein
MTQNIATLLETFEQYGYPYIKTVLDKKQHIQFVYYYNHTDTPQYKTDVLVYVPRQKFTPLNVSSHTRLSLQKKGTTQEFIDTYFLTLIKSIIDKLNIKSKDLEFNVEFSWTDENLFVESFLEDYDTNGISLRMDGLKETLETFTQITDI